MEKNIMFTEQLYRIIFQYATDADYNIDMRSLEELAYKAGYDKEELMQLIKDIYESLPVAYSYPQDSKKVK